MPNTKQLKLFFSLILNNVQIYNQSKNSSHAQWNAPIVPTSWEDEDGGSLEPKSSRLA